jgi:hypothetical protein
MPALPGTARPCSVCSIPDSESIHVFGPMDPRPPPPPLPPLWKVQRHLVPQTGVPTVGSEQLEKQGLHQIGSRSDALDGGEGLKKFRPSQLILLVGRGRGKLSLPRGAVLTVLLVITFAHIA